MNDRKALLSCLLRSAQLGQTGLRSVLDRSMDTALRDALRSQLREYASIEAEVHTLAGQRCWELREPDPVLRIMAGILTRIRLAGRDTDSRIAGLVIRGSTRNMIAVLQHIHRCSGRDASIRVLSQRLLDCERANISRMQQFL